MVERAALVCWATPYPLPPPILQLRLTPPWEWGWAGGVWAVWDGREKDDWGKKKE